MAKTKNIIVTRADSGIESYSQYTIPMIKRYSEFCEADFKILDKDPPVWTLEKPPRPHFRIMELYDLLSEYDRAICLDSDILINKNCPNLFDYVDEEKIGVLCEDKSVAAEDRRNKIKKVQEEWGDIGWKKDYINSGVLVVSKCHQNIFTPFKEKYWVGEGSDDIHLGYMIHLYRHPIQDLPYQFNHMSLFCPKNSFYSKRLNSHIVHYAGGNARKKRLIKEYHKNIEGYF